MRNHSPKQCIDADDLDGEIPIANLTALEKVVPAYRFESKQSRYLKVENSKDMHSR